MINKKKILNLNIILWCFIIEYRNFSIKKKPPLHTIPKEMFLLYITMLIWKSFDNTFMKYQGFFGFWLHFARLIFWNKQLLNKEIWYQILGGMSIFILYNKYTLVFEPFIRLFITYKTYNIFGFNPLIDLPVLFVQIYTILFKQNVLKKSIIIKNFYYANLIYHVLEMIFFFTRSTFKMP